MDTKNIQKTPSINMSKNRLFDLQTELVEIDESLSLSNKTEQETIDIITAVVDRIAPRYTFYGYTVSDMKQEAFIICMDALKRYDEGRPLENFLSVHFLLAQETNQRRAPRENCKTFHSESLR